jgi:type I restriction enzyme S subunit
MGTISQDAESVAWESVSLSSLYNVKYGRANPGRSGSIPVVGSSGIYAWTDTPLIQHPTIVIGRKGSAGQAWLVEQPSYPSDTTFYLEPKDSMRSDITFVYYALRHFQIAATEDVIPSLQRHELENMIVPLPPFPEQRAIAAVLSKIQAAVEVQEKIVATLKELKAATMTKLFREGLRGEPLKQTEIGEIPESWEVVQVGDLMKLGSGNSRPSDLSAERDERTPYSVYGGNGIMGYSASYITSEESIVIGRVGVYCGSVHIAPPRSWITDNALYHRDPISERASLHFLAELLGFLQLNRLHRKGAQPLVTQGIVHSVKIQLPPKAEQEQIAHVAKSLDTKTQEGERRLASIKSLFSSVFHLLMTGQVRVGNLKNLRDNVVETSGAKTDKGATLWSS